jgi:hypothetical protein
MSHQLKFYHGMDFSPHALPRVLGAREQMTDTYWNSRLKNIKWMTKSPYPRSSKGGCEILRAKLKQLMHLA